MVTGGACDKRCKEYGLVCQRVFEGKRKTEVPADDRIRLAEYYAGIPNLNSSRGPMP